VSNNNVWVVIGIVIVAAVVAFDALAQQSATR
jgi:hypothetical protein